MLTEIKTRPGSWTIPSSYAIILSMCPLSLLRLTLGVVFGLGTILLPSPAPSLETEIEADFAEFGKAAVIISVDGSQMDPPQSTTADALSTVASALTEEDRQSLHRIGGLPVVAGSIGLQSFAALKSLPGVKVIYDRPISPSLAETRIAIGLSENESAQANVRTSSISADQNAHYAVAVVDTGFDNNNAFFAGRILREACFSRAKSPRYEIESLCPNGYEVETTPGAAGKCPPQAGGCKHGTHVAGIVSGFNGLDLGKRLDGISPATPLILINVYTLFKNPKQCLLNANTSAPCVLSFTSNQLEALEYVRLLSREHRIAAVNFSLGEMVQGDECEDYILAPLIKELRNLGVLTVVAAGNDGATRVRAPACVDASIAVAATDKSNHLALDYPPPAQKGTNFSAKVDVVAPGVNLVSSQPNGAFGAMTGTSMAAPVVSASIARLRDIIGPLSGLPQGTKQHADLVEALIRGGKSKVGNGQISVPVLDFATAQASASGAATIVIAEDQGVSAPAGAAGERSLPEPEGSSIILFGSRTISGDDQAAIKNWAGKTTGAKNVEVHTQSDPTRVIVESKVPIDKSALENFSKSIGLKGKAVDESISSFH